MCPNRESQKGRVVATGFEEEGNHIETDPPTYSHRTLKCCVAKIIQESWMVKSLDVRAAYL